MTLLRQFDTFAVASVDYFYIPLNSDIIVKVPRNVYEYTRPILALSQLYAYVERMLRLWASVGGGGRFKCKLFKEQLLYANLETLDC